MNRRRGVLITDYVRARRQTQFCENINPVLSDDRPIGNTLYFSIVVRRVEFIRLPPQNLSLDTHLRSCIIGPKYKVDKSGQRFILAP